MALIKSQQASMINDAIVLDLGDLRRQAAAMRQSAEVEAARIIAAAEQHAAGLGAIAEKKGYAEGFAKGQAEGFTAGQKTGHDAALTQASAAFQQLQAAWVAAAQRWDAERRQMLLEARQSLLQLAVEMARKIVHKVPQRDSSVITDQVAAAIEHVARPCDVSIAINPADRPLLEQAMPQLVLAFGQIQHVTLTDDPALERGGCILSYGKGRIDATLDTQLDRLIDEVLGGGDIIPSTNDDFDDSAPPDASPAGGDA
jgi:flagellar assembly protein FliH